MLCAANFEQKREEKNMLDPNLPPLISFSIILNTSCLKNDILAFLNDLLANLCFHLQD